MTHVYGAHGSPLPDTGMLDQYIFMMYVGFVGDFADTLFKLAGLRSGLSNQAFSDADAAGSLEGVERAASMPAE